MWVAVVLTESPYFGWGTYAVIISREMLKKLSVIDNVGRLAKGYLQLRNSLRVDHKVDVFQEKRVFLEQSSTTSMKKLKTPSSAQTLAGIWTHMVGAGC